MDNLISIDNIDLHLTDEELGALSFLKQEMPHLVNYFKMNCSLHEIKFLNA